MGGRRFLFVPETRGDPADAVARFEELRNTATITKSQLERLPLAERKSYKPTGKMRVVHSTPSESVSGKFFGKETLAELKEDGRFRVLAEQLSAHHDLKTSGRQVAKLEDIAIVRPLVILF